ncbi:retrovirus-related pol polyprotein from transposon TNT 1-94 [Tanacetum coccineum]
MLVQPIEDEGEHSERPSEPQLTPSPPHPSKVHVAPQSDPSHRPSPTTHIPDSIPESSGRNHGGQSSSDKSLSGNEGDMTLQSVYDLCISLCTQVTDQAKEINHLKAQIKKLKKKAKPIITHHRAWMKSGRKPAKTEPSVHKDPLFNELADDTLDYMDTENAQDVGRTRNVVYEEEESVEDAVSTEDVVSTDKEKVSTDRSKVSTDRSRVSTDKEEVSTDRPDEGTDDQTKGRYDPQTPPTTTTPSIFGDDETIAQVLIIMSQNKEKLKEKEKGVELKDVEETERPRPTSTRSLLTLKPLPKIDPKDKGKKKIEEEDESDTESEGIPEAEKKFKQLARDEEMARKVQEDWEAEEEVKKLAEEEAIKAALSNEYDFIQARIEADRLLALRLQDEEREQFTVEERAKFLHDTIAAQRRFLAEQRAIAIRNRPPTRTQLRNQMMTYERFDESFTAVGSTEDKRKIKEMNEGAKDLEQKRLKKKVAKETPKKEDTAKVPAKVDVTEQGTKKRKGGHIKMLARKRKRPQSDVDSNDEDRKQDLFHLYELVMKQYSEVTMEGIELILWGDLKIMMESSKEENDQSDFWNWGDMKIMMGILSEENDQIAILSTVASTLDALDWGWLKEDSTMLISQRANGTGVRISNPFMADCAMFLLQSECWGLPAWLNWVSEVSNQPSRSRGRVGEWDFTLCVAVKNGRLPKKWLSFYQSLRDTNHVKDSKLASLFGKLKYEENLKDSIYETEKNIFSFLATPLSMLSFYLLFSSAKATNQTECHKCGKKGHFARDCWLKISVPSYQSPVQLKSLSSPQHKPELRPTKDFEAKYNKVKAKLTLLSSSSSASKALTVKNKGLTAESYEWDEDKVSSDDNEMVEVKVLMALAEENDAVSKEGAKMVNGYLHKYVEQPGPKVVFRDDSTCTTEGYGSIKCNGIVFTKFDEKRGTIFNSNIEVVMIAPRVRDVYVLDMTSSAQESCFFTKDSENLNWLWHKRLTDLNFKTINKLAKQNLVIGLPSLKCLHLLHMDLFGSVTPRSINYEKYTFVIVDEYSSFNPHHKDLRDKFDEKADDGYLLGYSLVSKEFRVFNTRRQQTEETYHITFDESPDAIKFSRPSVDNINIAENERYPPDEYHPPYDPS